MNRIFVHPWALVDEGVDALVARLARHAEGVLVACSYHSGKFLALRPHPRWHVPGHETLYYGSAMPALGGGRVRPHIAPMVAHDDPVRQLREACAQRGLAFDAWLVVLHSSSLGALIPEARCHTPFGDPLPFALSPSHPLSREWAGALVRDVADYLHPDAIELESVEYVPTAHGHHHELDGIALSPVDRFLLSLDLSRAGRADLTRRGIDVEWLQAMARDRLLGAAAGRADTACGFEEVPGLSALVAARCAIVTELVAELTATAHEAGVPEVRAMLSSWGAPLSDAWEVGHDPAQLAAAADAVSVPLYQPDTDTMVRELQSLSASMDFAAAMAIVPLLDPRIRQERDVADIVDRARGAGFKRFAFYNDSLVPPVRLAWASAALSGNSVGARA